MSYFLTSLDKTFLARKVMKIRRSAFWGDTRNRQTCLQRHLNTGIENRPVYQHVSTTSES